MERLNLKIARRIGTCGGVYSLFLISALCSLLLLSCGKNPSLVEGSSNTNSDYSVISDSRRPTNQWHWDQAKADALQRSANQKNNPHGMEDALAYGAMMREKAEHEPPSTEVPLPNFPTGPGAPVPLGRNFYEPDPLHPGYIVCIYSVYELHYDTSNEAEWFSEALMQIRNIGPAGFPPVKWFVIAIVNRAEWKDENTMESSHKAGLICPAKDVFDRELDIESLLSRSPIDRHPFSLGPPSDPIQSWPIVDRYAATNSNRVPGADETPK